MITEIGIHRIIRDYEEAEIGFINIGSAKIEGQKEDYYFYTRHLPDQPIGEAVEEHLKTLKLRLKINGRK